VHSIDIICPQILRAIPPAWFRPVGRQFIEFWNQRFGMNWGAEWHEYCFAYFLYLAIGSFHNFNHPLFMRSADPQHQVATVSAS
jgi:hypothetical protein